MPATILDQQRSAAETKDRIPHALFKKLEGEVGGGHETGRERRGGELRACGGAAGGEDEGLE